MLVSERRRRRWHQRHQSNYVFKEGALWCSKHQQAAHSIQVSCVESFRLVCSLGIYATGVHRRQRNACCRELNSKEASRRPSTPGRAGLLRRFGLEIMCAPWGEGGGTEGRKTYGNRFGN